MRVETLDLQWISHCIVPSSSVWHVKVQSSPLDRTPCRSLLTARKPTRGQGRPVLRQDLIVSTYPIRVPSDRASFELCRVAFRHGPRPLSPDCWSPCQPSLLPCLSPHETCL